MLKVKCSSVGHFHGMRLKNFPFFGQCVVQVKPKANTCLIVGILEKRVLNAQKTTIVGDIGALVSNKVRNGSSEVSTVAACYVSLNPSFVFISFV